MQRAGCWALFFFAAAVAAPQTGRAPKLVVAIVVDQFRYDYLTRFRHEYQGGFAILLEKGAVFTQARYPQFPTVTAVGHSMVMTGATPAMSGIVGNSWYSREERRVVTSVCDDTVTNIGRPSPPTSAGGDCTDSSPASPRRMIVDTVGDELRNVSPQSKVVGVSLKARSAVLPAGHTATGAYWFDDSGAFVSSSFYGTSLPAWAVDFNKTSPANEYAGREWMGLHFGQGAALYRQIPASPWGNELIEAFAEAAIDGEQLGKRGVTDVLTISFSSNDYVGHRFGPDDPHVQDMALRLDHLLDRMFHFIDARGIGIGNTLVVVTADHGVAPIPERNRERHMPGGREPVGQVNQEIETALTARFGAGEWLVRKDLESPTYLNEELIQQKGLRAADVERVAAAALLKVPSVFRVYTREQLETGLCGDRVADAVNAGFFASRSGDIVVLSDPYWIGGTSGTTHGSPFSYDNHVPLIFMGPQIRPGLYRSGVSIADIAPTLSELLNVETPAGSVGRVLAEIIGDNR